MRRLIDSIRSFLSREGPRAAGGAATVTIFARVVGLVSQAVIVATFGAGASLDGFLLALIIPSLIVVPVAGGLELSVPGACATAQATSQDETDRFVTSLLRASVIGGVAIALIITLASPALVRLSGPAADPSVIDAARTAAWIVFPGVAFRVVSSAAAGLLIGTGHIVAPVAARMANPTAFLLIIGLLGSHDLRLLAAANLVGDFAECLLMLWALRRTRLAGTFWSLPGSSHTFQQLKRTLRVVLGPMVLVQAVPVADQMFVSSLGAGALTTFALAVRLFDAVRSIVLTPYIRLAHSRIAERSAAGSGPLLQLLRRDRPRNLVLGATSSLALAVGGPVAVITVFEHGSFDRADSRTTIGVLLVLAPGLLAALIHGYFGRAMVAAGHESAAARFMLVNVTANIALNALLVGPLGAPGIALSTTISLGASAALQRTWLQQRLRTDR